MKRQGNKGKTIKKRKGFCSGNSGNRKGLSDTSMQLFSSLCCQVEIRRKQTVEFEQRIRKTFKEEFTQTRRKATEEALNEQTSVIQETDYYRSHGIDSLLGYNHAEADTGGKNKSSDSDSDID